MKNLDGILPGEESNRDAIEDDMNLARKNDEDEESDQDDNDQNENQTVEGGLGKHGFE